MTKEEFMLYCWKRKLKYSEVYHRAVAFEIVLTDIPSRKEYIDFYKECDDYDKDHLE